MVNPRPDWTTAARDGLIGEVRALRERNSSLTAALHTTLAAMAVASAIDAVRAEYDFEPAIHQAASALRVK